MKLTKEDYIVAGGYVAWIVIFWFLGKKVHMTPATAFFGLAALTGIYAGLVKFAKKILAV